MKNLSIIVKSLKEVEKVEALFTKDWFIGLGLDRVAYNYWSLPAYKEEESGEYPGDDYVTEQLIDLKCEIDSSFKQNGVSEGTYEILIYDC